jgi:hypothetical protein
MPHEFETMLRNFSSSVCQDQLEERLRRASHDGTELFYLLDRITNLENASVIAEIKRALQKTYGGWPSVRRGERDFRQAYREWGARVTGGRSSRKKGNRLERALIHALQHAGFAAERVPLSGAARGRFGGDLSVPLLGIDRRVEVKARANGFRRLYDWLGDHDFLIVRADRSEPLVVVPFHLAVEIARAAENSRHVSSEPKRCVSGNGPRSPFNYE